MPSEPSSWALRAASILSDTTFSRPGVTNGEVIQAARRIDSAWAEHCRAEKVPTLKTFGSLELCQAHADRVARLVEACRELKAELHRFENGTSFWIRFCDALSAFEKRVPPTGGV